MAAEESTQELTWLDVGLILLGIPVAFISISIRKVLVYIDYFDFNPRPCFGDTVIVDKYMQEWGLYLLVYFICFGLIKGLIDYRKM